MQLKCLAARHGLPPAQQQARTRSTCGLARIARRPTAAATFGDGGQEAPPYAALSVPVYSLVTCGAGRPGGSSRTTMNIVTYASPIALQPRAYALGLYVGTLSWEHMLETRRGVLQVLRAQHAPLLSLLGRTSGRDVDKLAALADTGARLVPRLGMPTLEDCAGVIELEIQGNAVRCGDHDVVLCAVRGFSNVEAPGRPLYTGDLRAQGLLL